jgi:hemerythrin superfamily protein
MTRVPPDLSEKSGGEVMATDAITLIKNDHRRMEKLFDQLESGVGDSGTLLSEVAARLTAHSHAEEQKVYPALAKADPSEADEVEHSLDEHHEAERLLHRLQSVDPADEDFQPMLADFIDSVLRHIEEEETTLLPALAQACGEATLKSMGAAFEQVRMEELRVAGFGESAARDALAEARRRRTD